jgi:hypothetical protein
MEKTSEMGFMIWGTVSVQVGAVWRKIRESSIAMRVKMKKIVINYSDVPIFPELNTPALATISESTEFPAMRSKTPLQIKPVHSLLRFIPQLLSMSPISKEPNPKTNKNV